MDIDSFFHCCNNCALVRTSYKSKDKIVSTLYHPSALFSLVLFTFLIIIDSNAVVGYGDPVYIRSSLQLLSSDTLRWLSQDTDKSPLTLTRPNEKPAVVCRVWHTSLRGVGLVSNDQNVCNISTQEGNQGSSKYQTLSTSASRLVWQRWERPAPPPLGAVAISFKPAKYLASDDNSTSIGYLDPTKHLGSGIFPNSDQPAASCFVLREIEPERYELSDVRLKRNKGFIEEDIVLAFGRLKYEPVMTKDKINESRGNVESNNGIGEGSRNEKGKVESILSYDTSSMDSWGQGYLMSKGLPTLIKLNDGSVKSIEWGIPSSNADKTETITAVAELDPGTGVNVTLHATRVDGEMSYVATLKTIFKDGTSSTRTLEGHRRLKDIQDIRLEHGKLYFLSNDSIVPELLTTPSSTTTTARVVADREDQYGRKVLAENSDELMSDQGYASNEKIVVSVSNGHNNIPNLLSGNDAQSGVVGSLKGKWRWNLFLVVGFLLIFI